MKCPAPCLAPQKATTHVPPLPPLPGQESGSRVELGGGIQNLLNSLHPFPSLRPSTPALTKAPFPPLERVYHCSLTPGTFLLLASSLE